MTPQTDNRFVFRAAGGPAAATQGTFEATPPMTPGALSTLRGYPIVWGAISDDRGGYHVRLGWKSATFTRQVHALLEHSFTGGPLGDTDSRSMRVLPPDEIGVAVEIDLPDTRNGHDVFVLVRDKRLKGMSFAMVSMPWSIIRGLDGSASVVPIPGASRVTQENGRTIVEVLRFDCDEVSIVARPAFVDSTISAAATYAKPMSVLAQHQLQLDIFCFWEIGSRFGLPPKR